jgi:hypothetical protein
MLSYDLLRQGHELTGREALFIHISDCLRVLQNSRYGFVAGQGRPVGGARSQ